MNGFESIAEVVRKARSQEQADHRLKDECSYRRGYQQGFDRAFAIILRHREMASSYQDLLAELEAVAKSIADWRDEGPA